MVPVERVFARALWSFRFMFPRGYAEYGSPGGRIYLDLREYPTMLERALHIYERRKVALIRRVVKPGMTCVDVGANKGYFTCLLARLSTPTGRVLSFEPDPDNCEWLARTVAANEFETVEIAQVALGDSVGEATFYVGKKSGWGSLSFREIGSAGRDETIRVQTLTLDQVLADREISAIDFAKVDVEGAELAVLAGASGQLESSRPLSLAIDVDVKDEDERLNLFELLDRHGFRIYGVDRLRVRITHPNQMRVKDIFAVRD